MPHASAESDARPQRQTSLVGIDGGKFDPAFVQESAEIFNGSETVSAASSSEHSADLDIRRNRDDSVRIGGQARQQRRRGRLVKEDRDDR